MCCVLWASPAVWIHDSAARSAGSLKIAWVRDEARWIGLRAGESGTVDSGHRENVVNLRYSQYAATPVPDHITLSVDTILQWMVANRNLVNRYAVQCRAFEIAVVKLRPTMQCVGPGHCCRYSVSMREDRGGGPVVRLISMGPLIRLRGIYRVIAPHHIRYRPAAAAYHSRGHQGAVLRTQLCCAS